MGYDWIKTSVHLKDLPETRALALALRDERAWAYVVDLDMCCGRNYADGAIPTSHGPVLEAELGWRGEPGALVAALTATGHLVKRRSRLIAVRFVTLNEKHGWKLERDRNRMRKKRAEDRALRALERVQERKDLEASEALAKQAEEQEKSSATVQRPSLSSSPSQSLSGSQASDQAKNVRTNGTPQAQPPAPRLSRDEDVAEQAAQLTSEALEQEQQLRASLEALASGPTTLFDLARRLKRSAAFVGEDLRALHRNGAVERVQLGTPPITHWQQRASAAAPAADPRRETTT